MKRLSLAAGMTGVLVAGLCSTAQATVDAVLTTNIVEENTEEYGVYCYTKVPVSVEIGIPSASLSQASLMPAYAYRSGTPDPSKTVQINGVPYENINFLGQGALIEHTYTEDRYTDTGTVEYRAELDFSAVTKENGDSTEGRQATINKAKLALLVIAKNLKDYDGKYRMWILLKGLPSQNGLKGERVYKDTGMPYSGGSPLLATYETELMSADMCGKMGSAVYGGKSDESGAEQKSAEGCSMGSQSAPLWPGLALMLVIGLCLARRLRLR